MRTISYGKERPVAGLCNDICVGANRLVLCSQCQVRDFGLRGKGTIGAARRGCFFGHGWVLVGVPYGYAMHQVLEKN